MVSQVRKPSNRAQRSAAFVAAQPLPPGALDTAGRAAVRIPFYTEFTKRFIDIALSLALLALLSPVFLALGGAMRLSGREILFRQLRVGRHGRLFWCLKFRTMIPGAEEKLAKLLRAHPELAAEWERAQKLKCDPRVTRVGNFLATPAWTSCPNCGTCCAGT